MNDQPHEGNESRPEDAVNGPSPNTPEPSTPAETTPAETPRAERNSGAAGPDANRPKVIRVPPRYQPHTLEDQPVKSNGWRIFFMFVLVIFVLATVVLSFALLSGGERLAALSGREKIGLIHIEGAIYQGQEKDFWMDSIHKMAEDKAVRGIVLRIDSPGGAVGASQELYLAINDLREQYHKPVYVSMGDTAASGGYYIASAADRIYALGGTLTGSIGVIFKKPQVGELAQRLGIETEIVKSGRFKDSGSITRALTDDERRVFENLVGNTYDQFVDDILARRREHLDAVAQNMPSEKWAMHMLERPEPLTARGFLTQIADGRVYTGLQAKELGLIDRIGSLDDTIDDMARDLALEGRPQVYRIERRQGLRELLSSKLPLSFPLGSTSPTLEYRMTLP